MANKTHKVIVRFNQQQLQLLDNLKNEGKFGQKYEDIVVNVFREYVRQISEISKMGAWIGGVRVRRKSQTKNR